MSWALEHLSEDDVNRFAHMVFPNPSIDLSSRKDFKTLEHVVLTGPNQPEWSFHTVEKVAKILLAHYASFYSRAGDGRRGLTVLSLAVE